QVRSEELDLDRARRTGEIVDHVGQNLHELDAQPRHRRLNLGPNVIDHLLARAIALTGILEPDRDVATSRTIPAPRRFGATCRRSRASPAACSRRCAPYGRFR